MAATFLTSPSPLPGDGAWLLQQSNKKLNYRHQKVKSFLRQTRDDNQDEVEVESAGIVGPETGTLLENYGKGKLRTSLGPAPDRQGPSTIASSKPLSDTAPRILPAGSQFRPVPTSFLQDTSLDTETDHPEPASEPGANYILQPITPPDETMAPGDAYPPPPRRTRTQSGQWPGPPPRPRGPAPPSVTPQDADRFSNFPHPSPTAPKDKPAMERSDMFRAWQSMNREREQQKRNFTPIPPPQPAPATSTRDGPRGLPPHLRAKHPRSCNNAQQTNNAQAAADSASSAEPGKSVTADSNPRPAKAILENKDVNCHLTSQAPAQATASKEAQASLIRTKLATERGVKFDKSKPSSPALVTYSSSNEHDNRQGVIAKGVSQSPASDHSASDHASRRGDAQGASRRRRHRAGNRGRNPPAAPVGRAARWPTNAELRAAPDRDEIDWDVDEKGCGGSDVDSIMADSGWGDVRRNMKIQEGIDPDTGFRLTDWNGNWAPVSFASFSDLAHCNCSSHIAGTCRLGRSSCFQK